MNKAIALTICSILLLVGCSDGYFHAQRNDQSQDYRQRQLRLFDVDELGDDKSQTETETEREELNPEDLPPELTLRHVRLSLNDEIEEQLTAVLVDNLTYFPILDVLDIMDYQVVTEENKIMAGFTDVIFSVEINSNRAVVEERNVELPFPLFEEQGIHFAALPTLQELLGVHFSIELVDPENLLVYSKGEVEIDFPGNEDFADVLLNEEEAEDQEVVSSATADRIIRTARRHIGKPYRFGASTGETSRFDCSSFTQYAFGSHGIRLPRTSRDQAKRGRSIPVSQLRKGDLVFFYWPGRYQSNRIVGHVGIYTGNGNIIHATPSRGVHVVNAARSSYWRKTYLGARRISG